MNHTLYLDIIFYVNEKYKNYCMNHTAKSSAEKLRQKRNV